MLGTYIESLSTYIEDGDMDAALNVVDDARTAGVDAVDFLQNCLVPVMDSLGEKFASLDIFLPDLMFAAEVAKGIKEKLNDDLLSKKEASKVFGKVVIGTVQGDVHDIGKSMVATILEVYGFEIIDLGNDVAIFDFINAAERENADIIAMSSLLTTSMPYMEELVETLVALNKRDKFKIIVGGGPVSAEYAKKIGADGYSEDATEATKLCKNLLGIE